MNGSAINEHFTDTIITVASSATFVGIGWDLLHVIVASLTTLAAKEIFVYAKRKFFKKS